MRRLNLPPRLEDFERKVQGVNSWFHDVTDRLNVFSGEGDPTTSEVPEGQWIIYKNTTSGEVGVWVNHDGILSKLNFISVSVKDFGAVGDGVTDDTAAINLALASSAIHVYFPDGTYRITDSLQDGTPVLTSTLAGRIITCEGTITATTTVLMALGVSGANSTVQLNIDGNSKIASGIVVYEDGCVVEKCRINDLYTTTFSAVAIKTSDVNGGVIVRNNIIKNLTSVGDGSLGDGNGMSRAILLVGSANATSESLVHDNLIEDILGEEGDAITVYSSDGAGTWYDARVHIYNNTVKNFTRRAVKIQANRVYVKDNYITHDFASSASVPNALTVIDFVQGGNGFAQRNILDACKWFGQFSVFASGAESFDNFFIEDNQVLGLSSETTNTCISMTTLGDNVVIRGNWLECGTGRAISVGGITGLIVAENTIKAADEASTRTISLASNITNAVVKGNVMFAGARQCFIGVDAPNVVVRDNDVKCNTPLYMNAAGGGNAVVVGNTIDGTSGMTTDADTATGNRFGGNFQFGDQGNFYPAPLLHTIIPSTSLAGKYVRTGQIVFDMTPTAGSFIGWVATGSGLAESVTWKTFGAISA